MYDLQAPDAGEPLDLNRGAMPYRMLISKLEETIDDEFDDPEDDIQNHVRDEIKNRDPDSNLFEHEEVRRNNGGREKINLLYYGSRSGLDAPNHSEMYIGDEMPEPRRDGFHLPDMSKLRDQHKSRMRFIKFSTEADGGVTSGNRHKNREMQDAQAMFREARKKVKLPYDSKLTGRHGVKTAGKHVSNAARTVVSTEGLGESSKDQTGRMGNKNISNTTVQKIREGEDIDMDFNEENFEGGVGKNARPANPQTGADRNAESQTIFMDAATAATYKTSAISMMDAIKARSAGISDVDFGTQQSFQARAGVRGGNILAARKGEVTDKHGFGNSTTGKSYQRAREKRRQQMIKRVSEDQNRVSALNNDLAALMYKAANMNADQRKNMDKAITDTVKSSLASETMQNAARHNHRGAADTTTMSKKVNADILPGRADVAMHSKVVRYHKTDTGITKMVNDKHKTESSQGQLRRANHNKGARSKTENMKNESTDTKYFGANLQSERHIGRMGKAYAMPYLRRETPNQEDINDR